MRSIYNAGWLWRLIMPSVVPPSRFYQWNKLSVHSNHILKLLRLFRHPGPFIIPKNILILLRIVKTPRKAEEKIKKMNLFTKLFRKFRSEGKKEENCDLKCACLFVSCICGIVRDEAGDKIRAAGLEIDSKIYEIYSKELIAENIALIQAVKSLKHAFDCLPREKWVLLHSGDFLQIISVIVKLPVNIPQN